MADENCTTHSIYRIVCTVNSKCYVGQTLNVRQRKRQHFSDLKQGRHRNIKLQRAYRRYGRDAFYFEVIEVGIPQDSINTREIHWIAHFDSHVNGYNMTGGGDKLPTINEKECEWNGIRYKSIAAAARANGVAPGTISVHLKNGHTCDADVQRKKRCEWDGITYESIRQAALAVGTDSKTMQLWIDRGYICGKDVPGYHEGNMKPCAWNGVTYRSIKEAAEANGVRPAVMANRIRKGYTCDDDCKHAPVPCTWNGISYPSIAAAAKANGVTNNVMHVRIVKKGYTCDADMKQAKRR